MKRFYKDVSVAPAPGGFAVLLDGKPVKTPARNELRLPTRALAEAVAAEWRGQGETVQAATMPLLRLSNTAIDGVAVHRDEVVNFMAATVQGWQAQIKDPAKGAKLAVDKYGADLGLDLAQQTAAAKAEIPYMTSELTKKKGLFSVDPAYVEKYVYPSLEKAGITGMPAASKVIDTTVLDDVYKKISK